MNAASVGKEIPRQSRREKKRRILTVRLSDTTVMKNVKEAATKRNIGVLKMMKIERILVVMTMRR